MAQIKAKDEQFDEAIRHLNEVLFIDSDNIEALQVRADIYQMTGRYMDAWADVEKVLLEILRIGIWS